MSDHLTNLERMRIQMEYVVPLIRDLQNLLGEDVINDALHRRVDDMTAGQEAPGRKADFSRMAQGVEFYADGGALDYEIIAAESDSFDMDVHRCGYTQMMEELGARDLGPMLICNLDYPAAARQGMDLVRTQTQMQGATYCDFRYKRRSQA